jgi:hypothetical protein
MPNFLLNISQIKDQSKIKMAHYLKSRRKREINEIYPLIVIVILIIIIPIENSYIRAKSWFKHEIGQRPYKGIHMIRGGVAGHSKTHLIFKGIKAANMMNATPVNTLSRVAPTAPIRAHRPQNISRGEIHGGREGFEPSTNGLKDATNIKAISHLF